MYNLIDYQSSFDIYKVSFNLTLPTYEKVYSQTLTDICNKENKIILTNQQTA